MPARVIDGTGTAAELCRLIRTNTTQLRIESGITPTLAVLLVGENPPSCVYVDRKSRKAEEVGVSAVNFRLPADVSQREVLELISRINSDHRFHGILVQLPLPWRISTADVLSAIDPRKDADGFHPFNSGLLASGNGSDGFVPCTPLGCPFLLRQQFASMAGLHALVLGRSTIVGTPMAQILLQESCTVTIGHSKTKDIANQCSRADILVVAIGKPKFVQAAWIKPGATVIDVGINRILEEDGAGRLVGDVDFEDVSTVAGAITPVPGGVGPMTIACLLANTLLSACRQAVLTPPEWLREMRVGL